MDMQPRSLPKRRHISARSYLINSHIGKLEPLLLGRSGISGSVLVCVRCTVRE